MIALFARADHPEGYGYGPYNRQGVGRAHGYVVILVRCADEEERERVIERLRAYDQPFLGVKTDGGGLLGDWYGGHFDYLGTLDTDAFALPSPYNITVGEPRFRSLGDNRFVGIYEASEVLS